MASLIPKIVLEGICSIYLNIEILYIYVYLYLFINYSSKARYIAIPILIIRVQATTRTTLRRPSPIFTRSPAGRIVPAFSVEQVELTKGHTRFERY